MSSFGFTGTNAHVVLASGDESPPAAHAEPAREPTAQSGSGLLCIAAKAPAALNELEASYRQRLVNADVPALCAAANLGRTHFRAERIALLIDGDAVVERLRRHADAPMREPRVCLLFGARGEPDARLADDPRFNTIFEDWRRVAATLGSSLAPSGPLWALACSEALGELWRELGIEIDVVAGVGVGRLGAAVIAGRLDRASAARHALAGDAPGANPLSAGGALTLSEIDSILAEPPDRRPSHVLCLGQGFGDAAERLAAAGAQVLAPRANEGLDRRILARLYVDGASIDWRHVHGARRDSSLDLPSYPWQRERYWFGDELERDPTLKVLPRMPGTDALRFEVTISARSPAWLSEHALHLGGRRTPVFPAAAFLALAAEGARHLLGQQLFELGALRFERPLLIEGSARHTLQVVCSLPSNSEGEITIYSTPTEGDPSWVRHMRAALRRCDETPTRARPVEPPASGMLSLEAHYAAGEARGVVLGPSFRGLSWVALVDGEVRAAARLPTTLAPDAWLHPALLDSCFQGAGAPLYAEGLEGTWVPAGIERMRPCPPGEGIVAARLRCRWRQRTGGALVGDLEILDEAGRSGRDGGPALRAHRRARRGVAPLVGPHGLAAAAPARRARSPCRRSTCWSAPCNGRSIGDGTPRGLAATARPSPRSRPVRASMCSGPSLSSMRGTVAPRPTRGCSPGWTPSPPSRRVSRSIRSPRSRPHRNSRSSIAAAIARLRGGPARRRRSAPAPLPQRRREHRHAALCRVGRSRHDERRAARPGRRGGPLPIPPPPPPGPGDWRRHGRHHRRVARPLQSGDDSVPVHRRQRSPARPTLRSASPVTGSLSTRASTLRSILASRASRSVASTSWIAANVLHATRRLGETLANARPARAGRPAVRPRDHARTGMDRPDVRSHRWLVALRGRRLPRAAPAGGCIDLAPGLARRRIRRGPIVRTA